MKIKVVKSSYRKLDYLPKRKKFKIKKQSLLLKSLFVFFKQGEINKRNFTIEKVDMDKLGKKEPCLILMNHSSFLDLLMANIIFKHRRLATLTTDDGFIAHKIILKYFGCIPTSKFVPDLTAPTRMKEAINKYHESILIYPEATYSFDGRTSLINPGIAKLAKYLALPLVVITAKGSFLHDPLYNNLQLRKVNFSAKVRYVYSKEEIASKSESEIKETINKLFKVDAFKQQKEEKIKISEPFRADGLDRILYKCPHCESETGMLGKGITCRCNECGKEYELSEYGELIYKGKKGKFTSITDWYDYERNEVKKEINKKSYKVDCKVKILINKNFKTLYEIGEGRLTHDIHGFNLYLDEDGEEKLIYKQHNKISHSIYTDFNWYELGDLICIGDSSIRYCCVILDNQKLAAKVRMAVEYLYQKDIK